MEFFVLLLELAGIAIWLSLIHILRMKQASKKK